MLYFVSSYVLISQVILMALCDHLPALMCHTCVQLSSLPPSLCTPISLCSLLVCCVPLRLAYQPFPRLPLRVF